MNKMDLMGYVAFKKVITDPNNQWTKCTFNLSRKVGKSPNHKYENIPCVCWDKGVFDKINDRDFITLTSYLPVCNEYMDGDKKKIFFQIKVFEFESGVYKTAINTPIVEKSNISSFNLDGAFELAQEIQSPITRQGETKIDSLNFANVDQEWELWGQHLGVDKETFKQQMETAAKNQEKHKQESQIMDINEINLNNDYLNELNGRLSPADPEEKIIDATPNTKKEY